MAGKKKGGGGKKKGGSSPKKSSKTAWTPKPVPEEPLMVRKPVGLSLTVQVRGVVWRMMDFTERVPATMKVFELRSMISSRHGGGVTDFTLYKEEVRAAQGHVLPRSSEPHSPWLASRSQKNARNLLDDPSAEIGDLEFSNAAADATRLPFADDSFDAVTISFGLRNVVEPQRALAEFARVAKPGARLVVAEFAAPTWAPFRRVYLEYLMKALPRIAEVVSSDPRAYTYLAESIRAWPDRRTIADWMQEAGWSGVQVKNLTGGIVAVHRGVLAEGAA